MRLSLTNEQKRAAATGAEFAYIEAGPGSGKTTVAAERYGVIRYGARSDGRGVLALSFARSARGELERRVQRRWGIEALRWPHKVWTLDRLHCALVSHLLRTGEIEWPGGHTELTVLDTWRGQPGSRPLTPEYAWCRVATLRGCRVVSAGARIGRYLYGYGNKDPFEAMLAQGVCTHDEIRQVLLAALRREELRTAVAEYLRVSTRAVIVDEVFDGNRLDLAIVHVAAGARIPTTLIGDPWQALYEFRGAEPELVPGVIDGLGFEEFPVTESFRFETEQTRGLACDLRAGRGVEVPVGEVADVDVVLASMWEPLWIASEEVLPLSFGQIGNRIDAAIALLLDRIVSNHFGQHSTFGPEAAVVLGLDPDIVRTDAADAFAPVFARLSGGSTPDAEAALALLRKTLLEMGSKRLPKLSKTQEEKRVRRLEGLARRLGKSHLIPGMTIHQAKGREWRNVGVHLSASQQERLPTGLLQEHPGDRALYVALTRAKNSVRLV